MTIRRTALSIAAAVAIASGVGPAARAQEADGRASGWVFTPSLAVGGAWDDNVLLGGALNPGDFGTPVNPSVALDMNGRRSQLSAGYETTFQTYRNFDELNSFRQRLRASAQRRITRRLTVFAQEAYASAPTTDVLDVSGIPYYRVGSRTNVVSGGFEYAVSKLTTIHASYTRRNVWFDDRPIQVPGVQLIGCYSNEVTFSIDRGLSPRLTAGGEYRVQRSVMADALDRFNIHSAAGTLQYRLSPTVSVSAAGGIAYLDPGAGQEPRTGPRVEAGITHQSRYGTATGSYQQTFIPSFGFGGTFRNQAWSGSFRMPFGRGRAYAVGSVLLQNNEPLNSDEANLLSLLFSGSVGYRMTRWLNLEGFVSRTQQNERRVQGDVVRNIAGFRVVATKPIKLR
jgi:hypothetical protein